MDLIEAMRRSIQILFEATKEVLPLNRRILLFLTLLALTLADPTSAALAAKASGALAEEKTFGAGSDDERPLLRDLSREEEGLMAATVEADDFGDDLTRDWSPQSREMRRKALELRRVENRIKGALSQGPLAGASSIRQRVERKSAVEAVLSAEVRRRS